MTGFGTGWLDYDNDGSLNLFVANGAVNIVEALRGQPNPFRQRNQLFHNDGSGRFREVTSEAGPAFELLEVSRGAAFGDIDNDGDVDILVTNNDGPARLLLNERMTASLPEGADRQTSNPDRRAGPRPPSPDLRTGWESHYELDGEPLRHWGARRNRARRRANRVATRTERRQLPQCE